MLRRAIAASVLAAAVGAGSPASTQAGVPWADRQAVWVKLSSCSRSEHSAVFYGRMRRSEPGERLWMRFRLLERGADAFSPVRAPGLGRWRKSRAGVRAFGYRQRVRGLTDGFAYRARVDFRWYDAAGELTHRASRRSRICSQAGPHPNLRARIADAAPTGAPGVTRYGVWVVNAGGAAVEDVGVRLSVGGSAVETRNVARVDAGDSMLLHFRGPACETSVRAVADPADAVPESSETDNAHEVSCAALQPN